MTSAATSFFFIFVHDVVVSCESLDQSDGVVPCGEGEFV